MPTIQSIEARRPALQRRFSCLAGRLLSATPLIALSGRVGMVSAARAGIAAYLDFYNTRRPHRAHGGRTPDAIYFGTLAPMQAAA